MAKWLHEKWMKEYELMKNLDFSDVTAPFVSFEREREREYMRVCVHLHVCLFIHMCMRVYLLAYAYTYVCMYMHVRIYMCVCVCVCVFMRAHTQFHVCALSTDLSITSCSLNLQISSSFSFSPRWHCSTQKGPNTVHPVSRQYSQGCPWNNANVCLSLDLQEQQLSTFSRSMFQSRQHHKNMEDAKSVNREIAGTLEAVMSSHTQLQELVENLQGELGRRDMEIGRLKNLRWDRVEIICLWLFCLERLFCYVFLCCLVSQ